MAELYNSGDLVIISDELLDDMPNGVDSDMMQYCGKMVTIDKVEGRPETISDEKYGEYYNFTIKEDGGFFVWSSPMIASYADDFSRAVSNGVIITRDGTAFIKVGSNYASNSGIEIPVSDYEKNKHSSATEADIVEIYSRPEASNYLFEKGELIWNAE